MELLIVIAIMALLLAAGYTNWMAQLQKGFDGRRKQDLAKMKVMLEQYFNDTGCYPDEATLNDPSICGSTAFENQGMNRFVCDPETKQQYLYRKIGSCDGYRIFATLKQTSDPDIVKAGCTATACGLEPGVNYGLTSGVPLVP